MCAEMMEAISGPSGEGGGGMGGGLGALAGVLSSAAGARYNAQIRNQAIDAQNAENQKAMALERENRMAEEARQEAFEQQQMADIMKAATLANPENIKTASDDVASDTMNRIIMAAHDYNTPTLPGQVENEDVSATIGQIVNDRAKKTRKMLQAQAKLTAQGKTMSDIMRAVAGAAGDVATTSGYRRGSGQVAQLETNIPAATVRPAESFVGDLALLIGQGAAGGFGKKMGKNGAFAPKEKEDA